MTSDIPAELQHLRARVRRFVDDLVIPVEQALAEGSNTTPMRGLQEEARRQGLWALGHPAEIGGGGLPFMDYVYVNEVIGRSEPAMVALGTHTLQDSLMLHHYGTADQKERWLTPMVAGDVVPSVGMTEPDVPGSDPTEVRTTATLRDGRWLVNGRKWFITLADEAAFTTVFCLTDPEADRHRRFSMILVPTDTPGYHLERVIPTMGDTRGHHCEIRFEDVEVDHSNLLGERGQGFEIAQQRLGPGRIFHAMRWLGQAQRAFELMCERAGTRNVRGAALSTRGEIQRYIAESFAAIQAHRLTTLDAARRLDRGEDARLEISAIKFAGARMLHDVIDRAIQVHGALGVSADSPLERMYRDARYARIYDGPDEVHRMVVARRCVRDHADAMPWSVHRADANGSHDPQRQGAT